MGRPQAVDPQVIKCSLCHQSSKDIKEALHHLRTKVQIFIIFRSFLFILYLINLIESYFVAFGPKAVFLR